MTRFFLLTALAASLVARAAPPPPPDADEQAIRAALAAQAVAWNRGDLANYMAAGYWESDSLLFVGSSGPTRGYAATLARYRQRYPDAARMGQLAFEVLEVRRLSPTYRFVVGKWALTRAAGDVAGAFTLLWAKKAGRWVIVADHSS